MAKELLPHRGHVFLEWVPETSPHVLFHALTHERVDLGDPAGAWRLEFFEDDFAAVPDDSDQDGRLVDEVLSIAVYRGTGSGEL